MWIAYGFCHWDVHRNIPSFMQLRSRDVIFVMELVVLLGGILCAVHWYI